MGKAAERLLFTQPGHFFQKKRHHPVRQHRPRCIRFRPPGRHLGRPYPPTRPQTRQNSAAPASALDSRNPSTKQSATTKVAVSAAARPEALRIRQNRLPFGRRFSGKRHIGWMVSSINHTREVRHFMNGRGLTEKRIETFIRHLTAPKNPVTVEKYRRDARAFAAYTGGAANSRKTVLGYTLWYKRRQARCAARSVNSVLTSLSSRVAFLSRHERGMVFSASTINNRFPSSHSGY